jgi:hypothetical protein
MIAESTAKSQSSSPKTYFLVVWLRCCTCHRGFFAAGAPRPQACPVCAGGRLLPIGRWDLCHEAAPGGMLWGVQP